MAPVVNRMPISTIRGVNGGCSPSGTAGRAADQTWSYSLIPRATSSASDVTHTEAPVAFPTSIRAPSAISIG